MKKAIYFLFCTFICKTTQAQPVIHDMLNYTVGMTIKYNNCDVLSVQPGAAGANVNWMFTNLQVTDTIIDEIVNPGSTTFFTAFPLAAFAIKHKNASYDFIKRNIFTGHVDNQLLGSGDSVSGMMVQYPNPVFRSSTPFHYQDSIWDEYTVMYGNTTGAGTAIVQADAYGTLILPGAVYTNVLRVKTTYQELDTITSGPAFIVISLFGLKYEWYDDLHKSPLMTWDSTSVTSAGGNSENLVVSYLKHETTTTDIFDPKHTGLSVSGRLHNNELVLNGDFAQPSIYIVTLFSRDGKVAYSARAAAVSNTRWVARIEKDLPEGVYIVNISDNMGRSSAIKLVND